MAVKMVFTIDGDSSPLGRAIVRAMDGGKTAATKGGREAGSEFGKQFNQQVKSAVMSFIGAGAIIGAIRKQITEATKITGDAARAELGVEQMQELQRAAELVGMTVEELRAAAPEVVDEFTALMEAIRDSGGILDEETVRTLADAGADFKDISNSLAPAVALLAKSLAMIPRAVNFGAGLITQAQGVFGRDAETQQAGEEMMLEAVRGPESTRNEQRSTARAFRESLASTREADRQRRASLSTSFESLRNAGPQRDLGLIGMVPGASQEMVDALNKAVARLESIDRNLQ